MHSFCKILDTKYQILYILLPFSAICNSNLGGWRHAAPQMQFQDKKLDHNFVLILYNFVDQVPNFVHSSFFRYPNLGVGDTQPHARKMQVQHKKTGS